jgi:glycosyltransferase involved in cell wall biosynthesis
MTDKKPIFSIVVPCFNQEKYLTECLNSIYFQTYENWECIIINDGSTDNSELVALKFVTKDKRFIYKYKENSGLAATRNFGINLAKGTYILPLDGDDKIGNEYLLKANEIFNKNTNTKLVYCKASFFGSINEYWDLPVFEYKSFLFQNSIFCSAIFKKSDYELTSGYDVNMIYGYEDWEFWLQLLQKNDTIERIDSIQFYYRQREDSMISFVKNKENLKKMTDYIFSKHQSKYFEILNIHNTENIIVAFSKIVKKNDKLNLIQSSFSYKTFYKIEKKLKLLIQRFKSK